MTSATGWIRPRDAPRVAGQSVLVLAALLLAFLLRFDFALSSANAERMAVAAPLLLACRIPSLIAYRLHRDLWRYVGFADVTRLLKAVTLGSVTFAGIVLFLYGGAFPRSVILLEWIATMSLLTGGRLVYRATTEARVKGKAERPRRALIVGAGAAADLLIRDIRKNPAMAYEVVAVVDDDPMKIGSRFQGIDIVGDIDAIPEACERLEIDEILIAIPSAAPGERRRILEHARAADVIFRTVPDLSFILRGRARVSQLQEVSPEDLLHREPFELDEERIREHVQGRTILITGAAGSIGSELCRQLLRFRPGKLVIVDRAESPLHMLWLELGRYPVSVSVEAAVGDIQDSARMEALLLQHRPHAVYHAAAYKHVHLMEQSPGQAIRNNVLGTEVVARAAIASGVERFVFISTDKAVRPVGIMGMTKRVAEDVLMSLGGHGTQFVAVRFGNVLGSQGSVLPIFKWQIANGGPVTVTDPEAQRYFMLISEAAQLVIEAASIGEGGEVYFLDMGEPVRIIDLAENLIRMAGYRPNEDIELQVTGLKPGERLAEELVREQEEMLPTTHDRVRRLAPRAFVAERFLARYEGLRQAAELNDSERATRLLKQLVSEG